MKRITIILITLVLLCGSAWAGTVNVVVGSGAAAVAGSNMTIDIAADLDDGWLYDTDSANAGTLDTNGTAGRIAMGESSFSGRNQFGYFRFLLSAAIPDGATITSATIRFMSVGVADWDLGTDTARIWGENQADPAQIDNATDSPVYSGAGQTAVPLTTAYVDWVPAAWTSDTLYTSPDIKTIIQELIDDHSGLANEAHIQIWTSSNIGQTASAEVLYTYDYAHATGTVAQLYIEWTE